MVTGVVKQKKFNDELTYDPKPRVLLIDADSLLYIANHGNEEDIETAKHKLRERVREIITTVEENFNIKSTLIFVKGEDNFRHKLDETYKAHRKEKHPNIAILYDFINEEFDTIKANGGEADDYIYTAWRIANEQTVIAAIDKDIKSFCHGHYFNFRNNEFSYVTKQQSEYNFMIQMLIGDTGDNVNQTKGFGLAKAKKIVHMGMSKFAYMRELIKVYQKYHPDNYKKVIKDVYNLLCLHHVEDLNLLNAKYGS